MHGDVNGCKSIKNSGHWVGVAQPMSNNDYIYYFRLQCVNKWFFSPWLNLKNLRVIYSLDKKINLKRNEHTKFFSNYNDNWKKVLYIPSELGCWDTQGGNCQIVLNLEPLLYWGDITHWIKRLEIWLLVSYPQQDSVRDICYGPYSVHASVYFHLQN